MKKSLVLMLLLVLAFGTSAMAADVKVSGELIYNSVIPFADGYEWHDGEQYLEYKLTVDAVLSELTSVKLQFKNDYLSEDDDDWFEISKAQVATKVAGIGTLAAGLHPDYGTNPFEKLNAIWGTDSYAPAVSFATEKFGGLAGQVYLNPWSEDYSDENGVDRLWSGEVTYDLPVLEGAKVGLVMGKWYGDEHASFAVIGSAPVTSNITVYAECGKDNSAFVDENIFNAGAKVNFAPFTFIAEGNFSDEVYYFQATYPWQDISLNVGYMTGDGYWVDGSDLTLFAKVAF